MICSKISHKAGPLDPDLLETGKALGLSPVLMGILKRRNLTDPEAIRTFLDGSPEPFHDPYGLLHMSKNEPRGDCAGQSSRSGNTELPADDPLAE